MSTVERWIHLVVTRNVKQLNLTFSPKEKTKAIELPHCLVTCSSLEVLRLEWVISPGLSLPKFKGFPALRVLVLNWVDLLDDRVLVEDFLQSCPSLEDLNLLDCKLHKLDLLCISCPKLKRLSINCENRDCCDIKISCPKLVDLNLTGSMACNVFCDRLDSMKKVVYDPVSGRSNIVPVLFHGNSHVKSLWVHLYFLCETLVLTTTMGAFTISELIRILKNCPKLESLKLTIKKYEFYGEELLEWEQNGGDPREIMSPDVQQIEFFELNGEKPKLVLDSPWNGYGLLQMVFSWGVN
uniref:F-box/LRR-repeat protein 15/At3g58940/PEG3-like LRR domain-containing protein n=1 Tax=Lactuca sativa TaxID=4236 RepID=A0A9R1VF31_LACSA|nr:hypothetical protein LSAT_V11C500255770 [Lactuca sativa]